MCANCVWAYDFVFDATAEGRVTVVDEFTRECLAIEVVGSIRSRRVIEVLTRLVLAVPRQRRAPAQQPGLPTLTSSSSNITPSRTEPSSGNE